MMVLQQAAALSPATTVRFGALMHDLGKGTTPRAEWPRHIAHEVRGLKLVKAVCERLAVPNQHRSLALLACEYHTHCHRALELRAKTLMKLFTATDALRMPERFEEFLLACEADSRGRLGLEQREYPQTDYLRNALSAIKSISAAKFAEQGLKGKAVGDALYAERVKLLSDFRK